MAKRDLSNGRNGTNRRRFIKSVGLGAVAGSSLLAGCTGGDQSGDGGGTTTTAAQGGGGTTGQQGPVELNIWLSYITEGKTKKEWTKTVFSEFESQNNVKISVRGVPYTDILKKFRAARASGDAPHLVEVMTRPAILAGGVGEVINEQFQSMELADVISEKVMAGTRTWGAQATGQEGNIVSLPLGFRPYLSTWRTDWLEQAGIPKEEVNYEAGSLHWHDDIPEIYRKLKNTKLAQQQGAFPDATGMKQSDEEYLSLYIPQHGGSTSGVVNLEGTKGTLTTDAARNAVKMQKNYIENGFFNSNSLNMGDEEATTLQWAGKQAVNHMQDSTDLWSSYLEQQPQAMKNGMYTWGPPMNAGTKAALAWLPSVGFIKSAFTTQRELDAAGNLLDFWIADKQRAVKNAQKLGFVPVFPDAIKTEDYFGKTDMHKEFWRGAALKTLNNFKAAVIPAVKGGNQITYSIPRKMHTRIMSQGMSVEKATRLANEEINTILQQNS